VVVTNRDGHSTLVNSRALDLGGITDSTPNPLGGSITRDAQGRATGILEDAAARLIAGKSEQGEKREVRNGEGPNPIQMQTFLKKSK
jgi:predicted amidohydrolase YtcJ